MRKELNSKKLHLGNVFIYSVFSAFMYQNAYYMVLWYMLNTRIGHQSSYCHTLSLKGNKLKGCPC